MMVELFEEIMEFDSVFGFVKNMKLEKEFETRYGCKVDNIFDQDENQYSDYELIEGLLETLPDIYNLKYIEDRGTGYWIVYKLNLKALFELEKMFDTRIFTDDFERFIVAQNL